MTDDARLAAGCYSCAQEAAFDSLPPRELIAADPHWRLAHAIDTRLPGWLVLLPRRHVTTVAELTDEEAAGLGTWQVRASRALHAVVGCAKTYVVQFAEKEGFAHVHFHLVPRMPDLPPELRGPGIFGMLGKGGPGEIASDEPDELARRLGALLTGGEPMAG